jgi:hypothetical protein
MISEGSKIPDTVYDGPWSYPIDKITLPNFRENH